MSEWLGKPNLTEKDIEEYQPMLPKYFPALTKYFVDNQKFRINLILEYDFADKFIKTVEKVYGESLNPLNVRKAALEALENWVKEKSK
ncbi:MAG: hypothetical protein ACTSRG_06950 [Candidatus Helarchaeota archaeon]